VTFELEIGHSKGVIIKKYIVITHLSFDLVVTFAFCSLTAYPLYYIFHRMYKDLADTLLAPLLIS
jgi:uncharacterized membrane protein YagU involved in acid resistance